MKTAEEILNKYFVDYGKNRPKVLSEVLKAMEEYANQFRKNGKIKKCEHIFDTFADGFSRCIYCGVDEPEKFKCTNCNWEGTNEEKIRTVMVDIHKRIPPTTALCCPNCNNDGFFAII